MPFDRVRIFVLLFTLLPVLLGLSTICRGVIVSRRAAERRRTGQLAAGVVVDNQLESRSEGRLVFRPVVRFTPAAGPERTFVGSDESDTSWIVGETVQVRYDPGEPDRADLADARPGRGYVGVGLAFVIMGVVAFVAFSVLMPGDAPFGSPGDGGWLPFGDDPAGGGDVTDGWYEESGSDGAG